MTFCKQKPIISIVLSIVIVLIIHQSQPLWSMGSHSIQVEELQRHIVDHPLLYFQTINVNSATGQELQGIPRIGPVLAGRIVGFRDEHGPFASMQDLMLVKGIGEKTVKRLAEYVHIDKVKE